MKYFLFFLCAFLWIGAAEAQTLKTISPSTAGRGDRISFTITGSHTHFSSGLTVYLSDSNNRYWVYADSIIAENDTLITGKFSIPKYIPDVTMNLFVYTQWGVPLSLPNAFQVSGGTALPVIKSITPATGGRGDHINYTINCSDMGFTVYDPQDDLHLRLQDSTGNRWIDLTSITIVNDSVLQGGFTVSGFVPDGSLNLSISTYDNYAFLPAAFTVSGGKDMAKILSVTPGYVTAGDGMVSFRVTCSGTAFKKFKFFDINSTMGDSSGNSLYMNTLSIVNDSTLDIDFFVPASVPETQMHLTLYCPEGNLFLANAVKAYGPKIVSLTPTSGGRRQRVPVTITCSRVSFTNPSEVYAYFRDSLFNYMPLDSLAIINDSTISGVFNIGRYMPDEKLDVYINVMSPGVLMVLEDAFEISGGAPIPAVVSVTPSVGERRQEMHLTIKTVGMELTSFQPYQVQMAFYDSLFNYYPFNSVTIVNDSILKGNVSIPSNLYDGTHLLLYLSTPQDYLQLKEAFTVLGGPAVPHVLSATPTSGGRGDKLNVTIVCTSTEFTMNDPEYDVHIQYTDDLGNVSRVDSIVIVNDSVLQGKLTVSRYHTDNASLTLHLQTLNENFQLEDAFIVNGGKPLAGIISVDPSTAERGEVIDLKINCTGTEFTKPGSTVMYVNLRSPSTTYDITPNYTVVNDSVIHATLVIPRYIGDNEKIDVMVYIENGSHLSMPEALTIFGGDDYGIPTIESVTPSQVKNGETVDITITCQNTVFTTSDISYVYIADVMVNSWTVVNRTTLKVNITPLNLGYKDITIRTLTDGILNKVSAFEVITNPNGPRIRNVDPPVFYKGSQMDVTITGVNTHFKQANVLGAGFSSPSNAVTVSHMEALNDTIIKCQVTIKSGIDNEVCQLFVYDEVDGGMQYTTEIWILNTGVQEPDGNQQRLVVYPNPTSGSAYMDVTLSSAHPYQLNVMNLAGALVYTSTVTQAQSGKQTITLNREEMGLKDGFYFVQLKQDDKTYYAKMQIR